MFIEPTEFLKEVEQTLAQTGRVALTGIGGIGKTSLAVEIAYRYSNAGRYAWWIGASNEEQIINGFVEIAQRWTGADFEKQDSANRARVARECKAEIETRNLDCLLVFDDVTDLEVAQSWFPRSTRAHILITTQLAITGDIASGMPVPLLSREEGAKLLLQRAGRLRPGQSLNDIATQDRKAALQLAGKSLLGGLPLALNSAGAYMEEEALSPGQFLALYQQKRADVLSHTPTAQRRKHDSVLTTVTLAFDRLSATRDPVIGAAAGILVQFCAYLAPEPAPERLFATEAFWNLVRTHAGLPDTGKTEDVAREALKRAAGYSLLQRNVDQSGDLPIPTATMHHVVQECLRLLQEQRYAGTLESRPLARQAARAIEEILAESVDANDWAAFGRIYPHALACETLYQEDDTLRTGSAARSGYTLETFFDEVQIQRALASGVWDLFPSYMRFREIETPAGQARLARLLATLDRVCPDPLTARQGLASIFFAVHYWWDCYFVEPDKVPLGGQRLLEAWQKNHPLEEDQDLLAQLGRLHASYPFMCDYAGRPQKQAQWRAVAGAVRNLQSILKIAGPQSAVRPIERFLRGITDIYLAEALGCLAPEEAGTYLPDDLVSSASQDPGALRETALAGLYAEAETLFAQNGDAFFRYWAYYGMADTFLEIGKRESAGGHYLEIAGKNGRKALRGALETDPSAEVDHGELVANAYRILADLAALEQDPEKQKAVWGYRCLALLGACAFLLSDKDAYALAFYREQRDRLRDDLKRLPRAVPEARDHAVAVGCFFRTFWRAYWKQPLPKMFAITFLADLDSQEPECLLIPPAPNPKEIAEWGEEAASFSDEQRRLQEVLQKMPGMLSKQAGLAGVFPLPPEALEVAEWLLAASQGFPEEAH